MNSVLLHKNKKNPDANVIIFCSVVNKSGDLYWIIDIGLTFFICGNEIQVMSVIAIHLFTLRAFVILSLVFLRLLISYNTFPVVF